MHTPTTIRAIIREMEVPDLEEKYQELKQQPGLTRFARLQRDADLLLIAKNYRQITGEEIE